MWILIASLLISLILILYILLKKKTKFVGILNIILIFLTFILFYFTNLFSGEIFADLNFYSQLDTIILTIIGFEAIIISITLAGFIKQFIIKSKLTLKILYLINIVASALYLVASYAILTNYRYIILILRGREYNTNNDFAFINPYIRFINDNVFYLLFIGLVLLVIAVVISILEFKYNDVQNTEKVVDNSEKEHYEFEDTPTLITKRRQNKNLEYIIIDDDIKAKTNIRNIRLKKGTKDFVIVKKP